MADILTHRHPACRPSRTQHKVHPEGSRWDRAWDAIVLTPLTKSIADFHGAPSVRESAGV